MPSPFACTIGRRYRAEDARAATLGLMPQPSRISGFDAFTNAAARMGFGTPNLAESADYTMVRVSYNYWLLITLYRNHWISRRIVDAPAQDMVRAWPTIQSDLSPEDLDRLDQAIRRTKTKSRIMDTLKLARLFGGAAALIIIDGHENRLDEPLKLDTIEPGAYHGLLPFDRWTGITPLGDVSTDITNPLTFNLPEFYQVTQAGGQSFRIHASRLLRFSGPSVPAPEYQAQQYWGISVLEPAYEEIRKRDNMSWNILSLTFRACILAMKSKDLAQSLSGAGMSTAALQQFQSRMQNMNQLLSNQSMLVLSEEGGLESINYTFSGLSEIYQQFQLDISGAADMPASRLFGRTITGLGQSNDADERIYEERIAVNQEEGMRPPLDTLYGVIAMSELGEVPDDMVLRFPSIRVLTEQEKSVIASANTTNIVALTNAGILDKPQALKEVKQQSDLTGFGTNVTDEDVEAAEKEQAQGLGGLGEEMPPEEPGEGAEQEAKRAADAWEEGKHPRVESGPNGGEFRKGGRGNGGASKSATLESAPDREQWPEHIKKLKLPPAWKDVRINPDPEADLLAVGKDAKDRPQYVYSQRFQGTQAEAKFARISELDAKFDKVRRQNAEHLKSDDPRIREKAECARLVMAMGIRPGSETDTKAKVKAYGATTLQGQHVVEEEGQLYLRFTGKKGVAINLPVTDPEIAEVLRHRAAVAGRDGKLFPEVSSASLLDYTHTLDGGKFKTKDLRTLLATRTAMNQVAKVPPPKTEKDYKRCVLEIAKAVSARLGNTPKVALQSYINPVVFAPWRSSLAA